jgi:putative addiction module CopG family antidote
MDTSLPPDVQQFVTQELAAGRYRSETELVINAVRRLRDDDDNLQRFKNQLREELAAIERGEGIVLNGDEELGAYLDQIDAEVDAEIAAAKRAAL